jgi:hypothetical protein
MRRTVIRDPRSDAIHEGKNLACNILAAVEMIKMRSQEKEMLEIIVKAAKEFSSVLERLR